MMTLCVSDVYDLQYSNEGVGRLVETSERPHPRVSQLDGGFGGLMAGPGTFAYSSGPAWGAMKVASDINSVLGTLEHRA